MSLWVKYLLYKHKILSLDSQHPHKDLDTEVRTYYLVQGRRVVEKEATL